MKSPRLTKQGDAVVDEVRIEPTCRHLMTVPGVGQLLRVWTDNWKDLMDFEIVPVRTSAEMREMMEKAR